jgi:hypothetical protein
VSHDHCRPHIWPGQLTSGDPYGSTNCAAYALAKGIEFDTCGQVILTGARVRQLSSEPIPDPRSPGLHHGQLRDVAAQFGLRVDVLYGAPWDEFEDANRDHAVLLAINYRPIQYSSFSGQRTFSGNHELLVLPQRFTYDSLCDGRLSNGARVFRGPAVYPESLLMQAAAAFPGVGWGRVNMAVLPHRHPYIDLPDTSTGPRVVLDAPTPSEVNVAITTAYRGHTMRLAKGQPLFRHPGGVKVTQLSAAGSVEYIGRAGGGWAGVRVTTQALYADGIGRPTVLYVPSAAGVVE